MKYFKLVGLISLLTLFTTGCSIDSQSPEQLIKDKPVYNEDKKIIYDGINQMLTRYTKLIVPLNSKECGSINEIDLNTHIITQTLENVYKIEQIILSNSIFITNN